MSALDPQEAEPIDPNAAGSIPSFLDELRAEFTKPVAQRRHFESLPAIGGRLFAEYAPVTLKDILEVQGNGDVGVVADFLIRSVVGIHVLEPAHPDANDQGFVPLERKAGVDVGGPLRFDHRLAELAGIEKGTAREIVMRLFEHDEVWLLMHVQVVTDWMASMHRDGREDFAPGS